MSDKKDRFLNLERPRGAVPEEKPGAASSHRFDAVEAPGSPQVGTPEAQPAPVPSHLQRFTEPTARVELSTDTPEDQPFTRCLRCQVDSSPFLTACSQCGASFDTPEQRQFNAEYWASLRQASQAHDDALKQRQEVRADYDAEMRADPAAQERMVRELLHNEQRRYDDEVGGHSSRASLLLGKLFPTMRPETRTNVVLLVGLLLPCLVLAGMHGRTRNTLALIWLFLCFALGPPLGPLLRRRR